MNEYLILAAGMIILPGIYMCLTLLQTEKFTGISKIEVIVLAAAELAFFRMWRNDIREEVPYLLSIMRYVMLAFYDVFFVWKITGNSLCPIVYFCFYWYFSRLSWEVMEFTIWIRF